MLSNEKQNIKDLSEEELFALLKKHSQAPFRLKQLQNWLYKNWAIDFSEMKNLPAAFLQALAQDYRVFSLQVLQTQIASDGTVKWLSGLSDNNTVETVLLSAGQRKTVCISTQVGCQVRCAFCCSGQPGFIRDLSCSEIIDQVILACRHLEKKINNIVVMGMGEPLHNLENLSLALELLNDENAFALGCRHITISTSGIVPGIYKLADMQKPWNLAVSLHATNDQQRARIIPEKFRYPIDEIIKACQYHRKKTKRMPTIEYTLLENINDSKKDSQELSKIAKELRAKVNLIPCNEGAGLYKAPTKQVAKEFLSSLEANGVQASLRSRKGDDIKAACGQLRNQTLNSTENE